MIALAPTILALSGTFMRGLTNMTPLSYMLGFLMRKLDTNIPPIENPIMNTGSLLSSYCNRVRIS